MLVTISKSSAGSSWLLRKFEGLICWLESIATLLSSLICSRFWWSQLVGATYKSELQLLSFFYFPIMTFTSLTFSRSTYLFLLELRLGFLLGASFVGVYCRRGSSRKQELRISSSFLAYFLIILVGISTTSNLELKNTYSVCQVAGSYRCITFPTCV